MMYRKIYSIASLLLCLTGGLLLAPSVQAMSLQEEAENDSVETYQISGIGKPVILRQQRGRYQISCQTVAKSTIEKRISDHYTSYRVKDIEVRAVSTGKNGVRSRKNRDGQTDTIRYVMIANGVELSASQVGDAYYAMGLVPVIKFEEINGKMTDYEAVLKQDAICWVVKIQFDSTYQKMVITDQIKLKRKYLKRLDRKLRP